MKQKIINVLFCVIILILNEFIIQSMNRANAAIELLTELTMIDTSWSARGCILWFVIGLLILNFSKDRIFKS